MSDIRHEKVLKTFKKLLANKKLRKTIFATSYGEYRPKPKEKPRPTMSKKSKRKEVFCFLDVVGNKVTVNTSVHSEKEAEAMARKIKQVLREGV